MTSHARSFVLLTLVLAACSNAGATSDDRPPESLALALAVSDNNEVPDEQSQYFEDGKVTLDEYQEAFGVFVECATEAGVGGGLREQSRDVVTGLIEYTTQTLLLPPGQSDGTKLNDCYQLRFAYVEIAFQISDPTVLAQEPREQMDFFNENYRPCLEELGVSVPDDLEFNDEHWAQLYEEAIAASQDGRCGSSDAGG